MKIVSTFHPSSSVLCSVNCQLGDRDTEHLVVAKLDRLEVYSVRPEGLHHECGLQISGKICAVRAVLTSRNGHRSNLLVLTAHPEPELLFLSYLHEEGSTPRLELSHSLPLLERGASRIAEFLNDVVVHDSGSVAVVICYTGKLKVVELANGEYKADFDVSIYENNLFSVVFLPFQEEYILGLLYLDPDEQLHLCARGLNTEDQELEVSYLLHPTNITNKSIPTPTETYPRLIPVPAPSGGLEDEEDEEDTGRVIVVGGKQILYFQFLSEDMQHKHRGKQKRLEKDKASKDEQKVSTALNKEATREKRKRKANFSVEWPYHDVTAWCGIDDVPGRFFIGDDFGRIAMLSVENIHALGMIILPLGEASAPTTLTYLTNNVLFLGSHTGNSQLLKIDKVASSAAPTLLTIPQGIKVVTPDSLSNPISRKRKGKQRSTSDDAMDVDQGDVDITKGRVVQPTRSYLTTIESFKNIAPIWDAVLVDPDGSGQNHVVACSGNGATGAIQVVRNGADFQEFASTPGVAEVTNIWSIRSSVDNEEDSHILVSSLASTTLYQINGRGQNTTLGRVTSEYIGGLKTDERTLAFSPFYVNTSNGYKASNFAVQVTPQSLRLIEWNDALSVYDEKYSYSLPLDKAGNASEIVAAAANKTQVVVALSTGCIEVHNLVKGGNSLTKRYEYIPTGGHEGEVSAISCTPLDSTKPYTTCIGVAYWTRTIEVLTIDKHGIKSEAISSPLPALPCSLLLFNFGPEGVKGSDHRYIVVGLADGSVATMRWKTKEIKDLKIISLGRAPVNLIPYEVDGKKTVFAAGARSILLYLDKNRLAQSPIVIKEVVAATALHTPTFQNSLVLATSKGLCFGRIGEINKMSIRTVPLGLDIPRKIVYEPSLKAFGVVCQRSAPVRVGAFEPLRSSFRLYDDNTFSLLSQYNSPPEEDLTAVATLTLSVDGRNTPAFCVGSFVFKQNEVEPSEGRLQLLTAYTGTGRASRANAGLELAVLASIKVPGCVYALRIVNDKIVAAINSAIMLFSVDISMEGTTTPIYSLKKLAEWNHNYVVSSLGSFEDQVVAGDQICSISLLQIHPGSIQPRAKDYGPLYPISVEALSKDTLITADDSQNIHTMRLGQSLGRVVLERDGSFYMTDIVSTLVRGSISSVDNAEQTHLNPEIVFFTSSGRIGTIIDIKDQDLAKHLTALERNLSLVVKTIGSESHTRQVLSGSVN